MTKITHRIVFLQIIFLFSSTTISWAKELESIEFQQYNNIKFIKISSQVLSGNINDKQYFKEIFTKDVSEFKFNKNNQDKYIYENNDKIELNKLNNLIPLKFIRVSTTNKKSYFATLVFDKKGNYITPSLVISILGEPRYKDSRAIDKFYDDCTMGYYNEVVYGYKNNNISIIYMFDISKHVSLFYKQYNITKREDDPDFSKLNLYINNFENFKNAKIREIKIKVRR